VFDVGLGEALLLLVLALVIFGPDQLPKVASQAGRALRQLRTMANSAKEDLREGLGPGPTKSSISTSSAIPLAT
jgi:sec-independent protein translocase protein TatB